MRGQGKESQTTSFAFSSLETATTTKRKEYGDRQRESGWGGQRGKRWINGDGRLDLGGEHTIQCTDGIL